MKVVRIALGLVLIFWGVPTWAQDTAAYVSRLTAQPAARSVLLTWKDAEGYPGAHYEIWRSDNEILKDTLSQAKLIATVDAGTEAYEDTTVTAPSFYLVLLKDPAGTRRAYYIPFRNKTTVAVKPDASATLAVAQIKVKSVTYANPKILVTFQAIPSDRKLLVFRRPAPIKSQADLKDASLLGTVTQGQSPYQDTPPPGIEFYYAVVDAQAWSDGRTGLVQSDNVTDHAVGFPLVSLPAEVQETTLESSLRPQLAGTSRALPLPQLQVGTEPDTGAPLVSPAFQPVAAQLLTPGTATVLRQWAKAPVTGGLGLPPPVILPEERSATEDGAGRYLVQIEAAYLRPQDWKGAVDALETVLRLPLDSRTQARARFYLGEAKANLQDYRQGFVELLAARDEYPTETQPFLDALFNLLGSSSE